MDNPLKVMVGVARTQSLDGFRRREFSFFARKNSRQTPFLAWRARRR
jgi:hypothetical protein